MLVVLLVFSIAVLAQTQDGSASTEDISWMSEPNMRGTWGILVSCTATIILCLYTVVHPNIPAASGDKSRRRLKIFRYIVLGTIFPEWLVWTAGLELTSVKRLTRKMKAMKENLSTEEKSRDENPALLNLLEVWTDQHSWLVVMGGYQLRASDVEAILGGAKRDKLNTILNAPTFWSLVEHGYGANFSVSPLEQLLDHKKSETFAKVISGLQALWFILEVLGRLAAHLPITGLEIHTLAHILSALVTYGILLHKPLKINRSTFISIEGLDSWLLMVCGLGKRAHRMCYSKRKVVYGDGHTIQPITHQHTIRTDAEQCAQCAKNKASSSKRFFFELVVDGPGIEITVGDVIGRINATNQDRYFIDYVTRTSESGYTSVDGQETDPESGICVHSQQEVDELLRFWCLPDRDQLLDQLSECKALPTRSPSIVPQGGEPDDWTHYGALAVSACYGALHASLWNAYFPTYIEQWFWRIVAIGTTAFSLGVMGTRITIWMIDTLASHSPRGQRTWDAVKARMSGQFSLLTGVILFFIIMLLLCFIVGGHCFFVVESFISLRSQPESIYLTPRWSQWIPHF